MSFGMSGVGARVARGCNEGRKGDREHRCVGASWEMHIPYAAIVSRIEERWKNAGGCKHRGMVREEKEAEREKKTTYSLPAAWSPLSVFSFFFFFRA